MPEPSTKTPPQPPRDMIREFCETLVFVVSLVLMLKLFVVEAFVIPTGSMAETLYGYQKWVQCPKCGYQFPVNSSNEVEPFDSIPRPVIGACCPNCRHLWDFDQADILSNPSGDRVLVLKPLYSYEPPERGDVVVFKYPEAPQVKFTAQNYIKRLWGLGGETIAIWNGDLYVCDALRYPADALDTAGYPLYPRPQDPRRLWEKHYFHNADAAVERFDQSRRAGFPTGTDGFRIIQKGDLQAMAMRRLVYDNDYQSADLAEVLPPRWKPGAAWTADDAAMPKIFTHQGEETNWIRYTHLVPLPNIEAISNEMSFHEFWTGRESIAKRNLFAPSLITNFLGYNAGIERQERFARRETRETGSYWVGDLMVECEATFEKPTDEVVLEVSKGSSRFQARFRDNTVTLKRIGAGERELASRPSGIRTGRHDLRFANFDNRLRVWVDGNVIDFGDEASVEFLEGYNLGAGALASAVFGPLSATEYGGFRDANFPKGPDGFTLMNDLLHPSSVGASGSVTIKNVKLWADTFFTPAGNSETLDTYYVHPGHYLCLGDNSAQSSDGRMWGLVPDRLMLGKAVFVFFPLTRIGFID